MSHRGGKVDEDGMTERNRRFIQHYVANGANGAAAARAAGYSEQRAASTASMLLDRPHIVEAIRQLNASIMAPVIATQAALVPIIKTRLERQAWWSKVMMDEDADMYARIKASELLARSEGDFLDRVNVSGTITAKLPAGLTREELIAVATMSIPELDSGADDDAVN